MLAWEANILAMEGKFDEAMAKAEESRELEGPIDDPTELNGYHRLMGFIYEKQGDMDKAIEYFGKLNMDNNFDKYRLAKAHESAGNKAEAMKMYKELVDFNFNNVGYALTRNELKEKTANP